ncbi:hypothetical protein CDL15_Pgr010774 [Punica granatum]|nr:hypothetical protein CDL15_Pgr010774 [Punica granatum]
MLRRFRRDPDAALSFFHQLTQRGFSHDICTYSALVAILSCSSGLRRKLDCVLWQLISSESKGFDVFDLLEYLSHEVRDEVVVRVFDAVVKVYVTKGMFDEAIDALFQTNRRGFIPHVFTCNFLMNRLIEHGMPQVSVSLYKQLKMLGVHPNDYMYAIVIKAHCKMGDLEEADNAFHNMAEAGVSPNTFAYTTYIEGLCGNRKSDLAYQKLQAWKGAKVPLNVYAYAAVIQGLCDEEKLERAKQVLDEMVEQGMVPDALCYGSLIRGHCKSLKSSNLLQAMDLHEDMMSKGIKTNCVIVSYILHCLCEMGMFLEAVEQFIKFEQSGIFVDEVTYNIILNALCKLEKVEEATKLLEEMKRKKMILDRVHYTTLINGYCLQGNMLDALDVLEEMKTTGLEPDMVTYNVLASGFSRAGLVSEVLNLLVDMEDQGLKPNTVTHNMIIEGLCIGGKVKEAEAFFEKLEDKSVQNRIAMVSGYCTANYMTEAFDLFLELAKEGILVKKNCCFKLLRNLCIGDYADRALFVLETMSAFNMEPTKALYTDLIAGLCRAGHLRKARSLFDATAKRGLIPDVIMFTSMIRGYLSENYFRQAFDLFISMKIKGIEPDVRAYTVLLDGYFKAELTRARSFTKKEDIDAGICDIFTRFLVEMKNEGTEPDVFYYNVMIDILCKLGKLEEAKDLLSDMMEMELQPNAVTYTVLLDGYSKAELTRARSSTSRRKREAIDAKIHDIFRGVLVEMTNKGIEPDVFYYTVMIDILCKLGKLEEAGNLLSDMKEMGVQPNAVTYTALILGCCHFKKVERAMQIAKEMDLKGIDLDDWVKSILECSKVKPEICKSQK